MSEFVKITATAPGRSFEMIAPLAQAWDADVPTRLGSGRYRRDVRVGVGTGRGHPSSERIVNAAREGQGGLIALSVEEAGWLIDWGITANVVRYSFTPEQIAFFNRIREWRDRHVPAGAVDDD